MSNSLSVVLLLVLGFVQFLLPSTAKAQTEPLTVESGWEYRWGDSPFSENGIPIWINEDGGKDLWQTIDFPSNPPEREGRRNVWYKVTLPKDEWRDPILYIFSIDLIAEVYFKGRKIYQYGTFDENGQGVFEGWPWHAIDLPKGFSGEEIYFRIYSSYSDIGLWGEIILMERIDLLRHIIANSMEKIIISGVSLLIAFVAFMFVFVQSDHKTYTLISLFTLASSVMLFSGSQATQLLFKEPLLWNNIGATSYFILPIIMALLFGTWCQATHQKVIKLIWIIHAIFAIVAISGSVIGFLELSTMNLVFDSLFSITLIILFAISFSEFRYLSGRIKLAITAFALFSLSLLVDMGVAHNFIPWTPLPIAWGLLVYALILIAFSLWHFALTQMALKELNLTLEQKVVDRTQELEELASMDVLTDLLNRRAFYNAAERAFQRAKRYKHDMSILIMDVDYFKKINDKFGHAKGDDVIKDIASSLKQVCRETDTPARLGGDEFIVLLEEASTAAAKITASRLGEVIKQMTVSSDGDNITASIGISTLNQDITDLDELIKRADKALYKAKESGRDNVEAD